MVLVSVAVATSRRRGCHRIAAHNAARALVLRGFEAEDTSLRARVPPRWCPPRRAAATPRRCRRSLRATAAHRHPHAQAHLGRSYTTSSSSPLPASQSMRGARDRESCRGSRRSSCSHARSHKLRRSRWVESPLTPNLLPLTPRSPAHPRPILHSIQFSSTEHERWTPIINQVLLPSHIRFMPTIDYLGIDCPEVIDSALQMQVRTCLPSIARHHRANTNARHHRAAAPTPYAPYVVLALRPQPGHPWQPG